MRRFIVLVLICFSFLFNYSFGVEVSIIGDSLTVGSKDFLKMHIPDAVIDGKVGRKFQEAMERLKYLEAKGLLGKIVVIELGTNGPFTVEEGLKLIDYLQSKNRKVIFVNVKVPKPWEPVVNQTYEKLKELRPSIEVIDWYNLSTVLCPLENKCFRPDGYHLTNQGSAVYSLIIAKYV
ncbi:MAG: hypothetical protein ACP5JV_11780, partial [Thermus sp.]